MKELIAIKKPNSVEVIISQPAEKGNAALILKTNDYNQKAQELLDLLIYQNINKEPKPKQQ